MIIFCTTYVPSLVWVENFDGEQWQVESCYEGIVCKVVAILRLYLENGIGWVLGFRVTWSYTILNQNELILLKYNLSYF